MSYKLFSYFLIRFPSVPFFPVVLFASFEKKHYSESFEKFVLPYSTFPLTLPPFLFFSPSLTLLSLFNRNLFMIDWTSRGSSRNTEIATGMKNFRENEKFRESCRFSLVLSSLASHGWKNERLFLPGKDHIESFCFPPPLFLIPFHAVVNSADSFLLPPPVEKRSKNSLRVGWKLDRYRHLVLYVVVVSR